MATLIALAAPYQDERWLLCHGKGVLAYAAANIAGIRISDHRAWALARWAQALQQQIAELWAQHLPGAASQA
jgi:hypothetical protein